MWEAYTSYLLAVNLFSLLPGGRRAKARHLPPVVRASRKSSIFLGRMAGVMFMRVNSTCAHQVRPPSGDHKVTGCSRRSSGPGLEEAQDRTDGIDGCAGA